MRAKEVNDNKEFWLMMFEKTDFTTYIKEAFTIGASGSIMREETDEPEVIEDLVVDTEE